jgi:hypothetical protein
MRPTASIAREIGASLSKAKCAKGAPAWELPWLATLERMAAVEGGLRPKRRNKSRRADAAGVGNEGDRGDLVSDAYESGRKDAWLVLPVPWRS